jgi:hypothetical protein
MVLGRSALAQLNEVIAFLRDGECDRLFGFGGVRWFWGGVR